MNDTIAAIATGMAVTAIGIVRVSGPRAVQAAEAVFAPADGRPLGAHADRQLVYGRLRGRDGADIDLCLATVSRAPHSYTGEDTAELQCHGSPAVLREALEQRIRGLGNGEKARRVKRYYFANAFDAQLDAQGRILIPANLREFADLQKDVVVIGQLDHAEIWDSEKWRVYNEAIDAESVAADVEDMDF